VSAVLAKPHWKLLGSQIVIMAGHFQLLICLAEPKVEALLSVPERPFCAIFGWLVTSQAIQCWGRAVLEGWAALIFVEIFREQQYEASWLARGPPHRPCLCHCRRALSDQLSPIYVSYFVLWILLSHDSKFSILSFSSTGTTSLFQSALSPKSTRVSTSIQIQIQTKSQCVSSQLLRTTDDTVSWRKSMSLPDQSRDTLITPTTTTPVMADHPTPQ
jgi:hypothetical protein